MANALFDGGKERLLGHATETIDLLADNIKAVLVDTGVHTINTATDVHLDDLTAGSVEATSGNLTSKTTTSGAFDAADVTFASVASGPSIEAVVLYKDSGTASTSPLIAVIDTATGLPVTPSGGDITVQWGTYIFTL